MAALLQTPAVAEHLNFRHAANSLGISQSSISARVKALEEELGVLLFERNTRGVRLTAAGRHFVERITAGIEQLDYAVKSAGMAAQGECGRLRIGVHALIPRSFLAELIGQYREDHSSIELEITEGTARDATMQVRADLLDIAFVVGAPELPDCHSRRIWTELPARVVIGPTLLTGICFCEKWGGAMTIRTGKSGRYRYYACSIKARQGETGCKGRAIPMDKLDNMVVSHIEERLLDPDRLEKLLGSVLGRRSDQAERRRQHITELQRRAAESELRLKRLNNAIEAGVADLDDPALAERIAGLKVIRDQAKVDAVRAQALLESPGHSSISPAMIHGFARRARERIRGTEGGYRRDHLRALAQRVEVADDAIRIMGSKTELLRTLMAGQGRRLPCPEAD